tara:strand:- start:49 stop:279 length:231 start_codon:yes stop_codon:yes gene_type:complete
MEMLTELVKAGLLVVVVGTVVSMVLDKVKVVKGKNAKLVALFLTGVAAHLANKQLDSAKPEAVPVAVPVTNGDVVA